MAAGGPIEPFWNMYAVHKTTPEPLKLLAPMKIGTLKKSDQVSLSHGLPWLLLGREPTFCHVILSGYEQGFRRPLCQ